MQVPLQALQEISRVSLDHQRAILSVSEYGMDAAIMIVENLLIQNHARRIAATLLRVVPHAGERGENPPADIALTQAQLGEMASVGRQVVNRELQRMEDKGWIRSTYGRIAVLDQDALTAFARGG
ncbi:MAG: winged helix-turn-helix domain-containing protein [Rhizobiales bacterium]|nr:winged helix-turn-helix domain-containing protein [Hyphomicrobiales bacterium]